MNSEILEKIFARYKDYQEPGLEKIWITLSDILPKIVKLSENGIFSVSQTGCSIEGKSIYKIKAGNGNIKVLLWSQMHGDETTATKTIFDLLNFLSPTDESDEIRNELLNKLQIHLIPMLNPDGAEKHTRENFINIDINRDAHTLQCPESQLLQNIRDEIKPEFCFNLHDQNRYYSVGKTNLTPALSFLAPPFDYNDSVNEARKKSMQLIVHLKQILDKYIPEQIAKYSDDHEPRSFGDNFNGKGSATILIESGYINSDQYKEKIRELNFIAILSALNSIASGSYTECAISHYSEIPENENRFFDLILKNAAISRGGKDYIVDIGINRYTTPDTASKEFYSKGMIEEVGDLSTFTAHEIIDCSGLTAVEGKVFKETGSLPDGFDEIDMELLFNGGFTSVLCKGYDIMDEYTNLPFNILLRDTPALHEIKAGSSANLSIMDKTGVRYLIVNGFPADSYLNKKLIRNSLIFP